MRCRCPARSRRTSDPANGELWYNCAVGFRYFHNNQKERKNEDREGQGRRRKSHRRGPAEARREGGGARPARRRGEAVLRQAREEGPHADARHRGKRAGQGVAGGGVQGDPKEVEAHRRADQRRGRQPPEGHNARRADDEGHAARGHVLRPHAGGLRGSTSWARSCPARCSARRC